MNSRVSIFAAGFLLLYGVYSLRQGIKAHKASDIALGVICLLGGGTLAAMMALGRR